MTGSLIGPIEGETNQPSPFFVAATPRPWSPPAGLFFGQSGLTCAPPALAARAHARRLQRQADHNQRSQIVPQHGITPRTTGDGESDSWRQSAQRIEASEDDAPATCSRVVLLQLVTSFAMRRTKTNVNPPACIPQITGTDTYSQLSVTLCASFHGYISMH
jgi:hypothetical protein